MSDPLQVTADHDAEHAAEVTAARSGQPSVDGASEPVVVSPIPPNVYPFSVLHVLVTAWRVMKRNLLPFLVLACVVEVPIILVSLGGGMDDAMLALLMTLVTNSLTSAVVSYGVIMDLQGSRPSTRACIATGFAQLGRVLGVTLISTLFIALGMLLLVVPGMIVALMFYVIVPVTVIERLGIDAAMKRSRQLTDGRKGDLFLILLFGGVLSIGIELVAVYELTAEAAAVWRYFGSAFVTMFFSVTSAVAYVELRKLRDGTQVPEIATAFARIRK